jgi:hypothetical protein
MPHPYLGTVGPVTRSQVVLVWPEGGAQMECSRGIIIRSLYRESAENLEKAKRVRDFAYGEPDTKPHRLQFWKAKRSLEKQQLGRVNTMSM